MWQWTKYIIKGLVEERDKLAVIDGISVANCMLVWILITLNCTTDVTPSNSLFFCSASMFLMD